jgi:hypothetical protein
MGILSTIFAILFLAIASTQAFLVLLDRWEVMKENITLIPNEFQYKYAKTNPNIPLWNAGLSCQIKYFSVYRV